ncbi:uncharacterized protein [Ptychodera flava]|uniref:uncharacterized protein n=1 Tax=Ptychodera flava TaxID=63121 RepID=UPI003969DE21
MVFGFSMVTSLPASAIRDQTFPDASFYLVNPYKLDTPLSILGYDKARYKIWKKLLISASMDAKAVFSMGSEIFDDFDVHYNSLEMVVNHHSLMLTPDEGLFKFQPPSNISTRGKFTILMFVDENDIAELSRESAVAKAMNHVAEYLHGMSRPPPKWIIVSIPKGREDNIKSSLDPHPHLQVIYTSFDASEAITLLKQSHLLLVPPSSINSINLSLSTIATGTPLLVPQYSPCHNAIMEYLPDVDPNDIVVDMKSGHTILGDKIKHAVLQYSAYLKRASAMRGRLAIKVKEIADNMKMMFAKLICQSQDDKLVNQSNTTVTPCIEDKGNAEADSVSSTDNLDHVYAQESHEKTCENTQEGNGSNGNPTGPSEEGRSKHDRKKHHQHKEGCVNVLLNVKSGAPENDKQMNEVAKDFFGHSSTKSNPPHFMKRVTDIHNELDGNNIQEGCLNFVMTCGSTDAADALWNAYSSGRLDRMADKTFLSIPLLDDIGARMLSLETFIDYQEYLQCKQDITEREEAENTPDLIMSRATVIARKGDLAQKQHEKDRLKSVFNDEGEHFKTTEKETLNKWLSMKNPEGQRMENQNLEAQRETLKIESASFKEKMDKQREEIEGQLDEVQRKIEYIEEQKPTTELDYLGMNLLFLEDADEVQRKQITDQIDEIYSEVASIEKKYSPEMKILTEQKEQLVEDLSLINERITKSKDIDELITNIVNINKGIVPKDTVRRLSRQGNGPGEVWDPWGLTINHNGQVVVSDNGDGTQPGSVKTVTADTAQIISTITFHGLPNTFRPTDVKMSKNNLYYIADDGNKCILVCDAKSRLKQIIDIDEVETPEICLGPDNTVFVADYNGRVIKYSKAGEMISSKQLSKPCITMNSKYQLIVSCNDEHCIYVLDSNLNTLHTFGHEHLVDPWGVSVDAIGENIYVADENKVKIFSAQGT